MAVNAEDESRVTRTDNVGVAWSRAATNARFDASENGMHGVWPWRPLRSPGDPRPNSTAPVRVQGPPARPRPPGPLKAATHGQKSKRRSSGSLFSFSSPTDRRFEARRLGRPPPATTILGAGASISINVPAGPPAASHDARLNDRVSRWAMGMGSASPVPAANLSQHITNRRGRSGESKRAAPALAYQSPQGGDHRSAEFPSPRLRHSRGQASASAGPNGCSWDGRFASSPPHQPVHGFPFRLSHGSGLDELPENILSLTGSSFRDGMNGIKSRVAYWRFP